jgi:catechol 2,3-dioxygenase-like lactoylglutathione lyase family enzyme
LGALILILACSVSSADDKTKDSEVRRESAGLKIRIASLIVDDQDKAEKFYTEILGFEVKENVPVGEFRWLTVVSPDNRDGAELALEPNDNPASKTFQKAIFDQGIPATMLFVEDLQGTYEKLIELGVVFKVQPKDMGGTFAAIFNDTCGNLIMIAQE